MIKSPSRLLLLAGLLSFGYTLVQAQSNYPFVADDFDVPETLETGEFRMRMLTIDDVKNDYEAVMSSVDHLQTIWPGSGWPSVDMTLEQNLVDLGWHQREFLNRSSFAYTVVTLDESRVLGCVYIDPTRRRGYDAAVYLWVRASELDSGMDGRLFAAVTAWLDSDWAFENAGFPGRTVAWQAWEEIPEEKR